MLPWRKRRNQCRFCWLWIKSNLSTFYPSPVSGHWSALCRLGTHNNFAKQFPCVPQKLNRGKLCIPPRPVIAHITVSSFDRCCFWVAKQLHRKPITATSTSVWIIQINEGNVYGNRCCCLISLMSFFNAVRQIYILLHQIWVEAEIEQTDMSKCELLRHCTARNHDR